MSRDPVVSVGWLAAALRGSEPPRVLDVRWRLGGAPGVEEFAAGHVPGAVYVDLETELAAAPAADRVGGRHPLPSVETVQSLVLRAGVGPGTVVVMDSADGIAAARAWWVLRHAGHADVRVLDGGWQAWSTSGGDVETGDGGAVPAGTFEVRWGSMPVVSAADLSAEDLVLIDARAAARFRGEAEPIDPVAGRIPGAVNAPATDDVDPSGYWVSDAQLRETYTGLGVDGSAPVATYCGSGVTAAHTVVALARLGIDAALYPGSWSDWISDPSRSIATGGSDRGTQ